MGTCVAVGDINSALEGGAKKDSDDTLARVSSDAIVVVNDAEENQRVDYHLLYRPSRYLLSFYHIHVYFLFFSSL